MVNCDESVKEKDFQEIKRTLVTMVPEMSKPRISNHRSKTEKES